jgi:hypothetical protein
METHIGGWEGLPFERRDLVHRSQPTNHLNDIVHLTDPQLFEDRSDGLAILGGIPRSA